MGTKSIKVKTLADKYGVSVKEILRELESQGFGDDVKNANSEIPPDAAELVKSYFDELMAKKGRAPKAGGKTKDASSPQAADRQEVHIKGPILVKTLAEALGSAGEPEEVSDSQAAMLSTEIAQRIQDEMTYPGQVKITVIRETRSVAIAK